MRTPKTFITISYNHSPFPFHTILKWYQKQGRHTLPWRQIYALPVKDRLYRVWIAEVMLQQTQVDRVIGYYERFLEKYPTIESLAQTTYEELFPYWQGLGYYSRARRMIELARIIVERHQGIFPEDLETLQKLPGIGKYTAQALLAFGYNQPILAVDANLEKIFARYYFGTKFKKKKREKRKEKREGIGDNFDAIASGLQKQFEREVKEAVPLGTRHSPLVTRSGREMNNALMDFAAIASLSYDHIDVTNYPLPECKWFQTKGKIEQEKREKIKDKRGGLGNNSDSAPLSRGVPKAGGLKPAKLMVFLHENHKKYWSSHQKYYEPFLIEPVGRDDRRTIQDYFSTTYNLEVSVRPSFGHGTFQETPVKLFHAQIQTGNGALPEFSKKEKEEWMEKFLTIL